VTVEFEEIGMRKLFVVPVVLATLSAAPVHAFDQEQVGREPTTNEVLADALIARPAALVGTAITAVTWVISLPFTLPSHSTDRATEALINAPLRYTFKRPIGQLDGCEALPQSCKATTPGRQ
jgi:hypothetical protein